MPETALRELLLNGLEYLRAGGFVMPPLALVSLLMWTLVFVKMLELAGLRRGERSPRECLAGAGAPWQRALLTGLAEHPGLDRRDRRRLLETLRVGHERRAERFTATILVLAVAAPLLGLFGTVTGMIATFDAISLHGSGNARALASGVSTALITTQTGLIVAVPGLALGSFLRRRAAQAVARMEAFCLELTRLGDAHDESDQDQPRRAPDADATSSAGQPTGVGGPAGGTA